MNEELQKHELWGPYLQNEKKMNVPGELLAAALDYLQVKDKATKEQKENISSHIWYLAYQIRDKAQRASRTMHTTTVHFVPSSELFPNC